MPSQVPSGRRLRLFPILLVLLLCLGFCFVSTPLLAASDPASGSVPASSPADPVAGLGSVPNVTDAVAPSDFWKIEEDEILSLQDASSALQGPGSQSVTNMSNQNLPVRYDPAFAARQTQIGRTATGKPASGNNLSRQVRKEQMKKSHDAYKEIQRQGYERVPGDQKQTLQNRIDFLKKIVKARTEHDAQFPHPNYPDGRRHADVNASDLQTIKRLIERLKALG